MLSRSHCRSVVLRIIVCSGWIVGFGCGLASAQTVQLPTIRTFSYTGSVLVPDRGRASLGGVSRSGSFSSSSGLGPFRRARQSGFRSQSGLSASATIIDLDTMDRQIRGVPPKPVRRRPPEMIAEGKWLVRYARSRRAAGDDEMAKVGYRLAIAKLDGKLLDYAVKEYRAAYPQ